MRLRRQRGSIKVRVHKNGTKVYDIFYRTPEGKLKHEVGGASKKIAVAKLNERLSAMQDGSYQEVKPSTFAAYTTTWLAGRAIKATTKATYTAQLGAADGSGKPHQLNTVFGTRRLDQIQTTDINRYITAARGHYKLKALQNQLMLLSTIFEDAASEGYCPRNPLAHRTLQRPQPLREGERAKVIPFTLAQVNQLLDALPVEHRPFFLTLALTGARLGEGLALQWRDILWDAQQVAIQRGVYKGAFYLPKSETSVRTVNVGPQLLGTLAALRRERFGSTPPPADALIFCTAAGKPIDPNNLRQRVWAPALKRAGLSSRRRIHDLRHTFASQLLAQRESLPYVAKQLGHASPVITLKVYSHVMPDEPRRAAVTLEEQLGLARSNGKVTDGASRSHPAQPGRTRTER